MLDFVRKPKVDHERDVQFSLNRLNGLRLNPTLPTADWEGQLAEVAQS